MFGVGQKLLKFFKSNDEGDFDFYFSDITKIARIFGFDFWSVDWKLRKSLRSSFLFFFLAFNIFEAYYVAKNFGDDFDLMVRAFSFGGPSLMFLGKLVMVLVNRDKIKSLISEIRKEFWNTDGVQAALLAEGARKRRLDVAAVAHSSKQNPVQMTEGEMAKSWMKKELLVKGSRTMKTVIRLFFVQLCLIIIIYIAAPLIPMMLYSKFETPLKLPLLGDFDSLFF